MVISIADVHKIVQNLSVRELENPEGAGVDLRLGEVIEITGGTAFIEADGPAGQGLRSGFETKVTCAFQEGGEVQEKFVFEPGKYYLVKTVETVQIPINVLGDFRARSTLFRSGLNLLTTTGAPGYEGPLVFGLTNHGSLPVTIQMGARIAQALFYRLESDGIGYRGQNQGGRTTASGVERQV